MKTPKETFRETRISVERVIIALNPQGAKLDFTPKAAVEEANEKLQDPRFLSLIENCHEVVPIMPNDYPGVKEGVYQQNLTELSISKSIFSTLAGAYDSFRDDVYDTAIDFRGRLQIAEVHSERIDQAIRGDY